MNQINNLTRESQLNEKDLEDLTSQLKQSERNTKIECEKIEVTYRRQLKSERDKRQKMMLSYQNEQKVMSCLVHSMGAQIAFGD